MKQENPEEEFGNEDEKFYFKDEVKKSSSISYVLLAILTVIAIYILQLNWVNLNQYNNIRSEERYPVQEIFKEQIPYFGHDYKLFKEQSGIKTVLSENELNKYWSNCVGSCEIPATNRFKVISEKQNFINWTCNERVKEEHFSGTQYAIWKLNVDGCLLTNSSEVKAKDKEEISRLKWEKQKEMEGYLVLLLIVFLFILQTTKKIIKKK